MATMSFRITLFERNADVFPETAARMRDLSPAFNNIIDRWATESNTEKFALGRGSEAGGVIQDKDVFWDPDKPAYSKAKRSKGFVDWLMVRTGELMASLTDPERFFRIVEPSFAMFGEPLAQEEADKARFNRESRPSIFLSEEDKGMVKEEVFGYLRQTGNYAGNMFAKGMDAVKMREEVAQMDSDFRSDIS